MIGARLALLSDICRALESGHPQPVLGVRQGPFVWVGSREIGAPSPKTSILSRLVVPSSVGGEPIWKVQLAATLISVRIAAARSAELLTG